MSDEIGTIVDELADELDRSIVVEDSRMRLIAFSPHRGKFDPIRERSVFTRETPSEAVDWLSSLGVFESRVPMRIEPRPEIGAEARVMVPIRFHDNLVGFLAVLDPASALDEAQIERCHETSQRLGEILQRAQLIQQGVTPRERELVDALLLAEQPAVRTQAGTDLVKEGLLRGLPVLVVVIAPPKAAEQDVLLSQLVVRVKRALHHDAVAATTTDDRCVLVIAAKDQEAERALRIHAALSTVTGRRTAILTYSNRVEHWADAARGFRQASLAVRVARAVKSFGPVVGWSQLGVYQTLAQVPPDELEGTDADQRLTALLEKPELVHTLETYLELAGDAKRTAEQLTSALWFCNVGHGRRELADAAAAQMARLASFSTFGEMTNEHAEELARTVCEWSPMGPDGAAFFTSGGSDAIDTAGKLVRRYWAAKGEPQRQTIIARGGAYHGVNAFGTSLGGLEPNRSGYGRLVGDIVHVPFDDLGALSTAIEEAGDTLAAVIGEPVLGAAGVRIAPEGYWTDAAALVESHGALLVLDEVITGFGRLGKRFGAERYGITPDLIVGAKGITSGYLPLGVVIAAPHVKETLWAEEVGLLRHGYTYSGHATVCAVGRANLDVIERDGLVDRVAEHEDAFNATLSQLESLDAVKEFRSVGYMGALELDEERVAADAGLTESILRAARENGVLVRNLMGHSLQVSPPLISGPDDFALIADGLGAAVERVAA